MSSSQISSGGPQALAPLATSRKRKDRGGPWAHQPHVPTKAEPKKPAVLAGPLPLQQRPVKPAFPGPLPPQQQPVKPVFPGPPAPQQQPVKPVFSATPLPQQQTAKPAGAGGNLLLAGYLAHEFLNKGTLFGKPWEAAAAARPPNRRRPETTDQQGRKPAGAPEKPAVAAYEEVAHLLKTDGAHIPGVVNPSQLALWLQM